MGAFIQLFIQLQHSTRTNLTVRAGSDLLHRHALELGEMGSASSRQLTGSRAICVAHATRRLGLDVVEVTRGNRLTPCIIEGAAGTGQICINGAAAHLIQPGDIAIVIAYAQMDEAEARTLVPGVVFVDHDSRMVEVAVVRDGVGFEASGTPRGRS